MEMPSLPKSLMRTLPGLVAGVVLLACTPMAATHPTPGGERAVTPLALAVRVQGVAEVAGERFAGATLQAFDLATGRGLPLSRAGQTDADGRFEVELPGGTTPRLVKLVASKDGRSLTTVVDARMARAIEAAPSAGIITDRGGAGLIGERGQGYSLAQAVVGETLSLRLNLASTAATQAFEGALKVHLQVQGSAATLEQVFTAVNRAALALQSALDAAPALATRLADTIGTDGQIQDLPAFQQVLADLRLVEAVTEAVHAVLKEAASLPQDPEAPPTSLTPEDFPIGQVTVAGATFTFETREGETVQGTVASVPAPPEQTSTSGASPTPTPGSSTAPEATPTAAAAQAGGSGGAPAPGAALSLAVSERYTLVRVAGDATGTALRAVSGVAAAPDGTLYVADPVQHQIRRVPVGGAPERVAGLASGLAGFRDDWAASLGGLSSPAGLLYLPGQGALLVCDAGNHRVRHFQPGGLLGTLAGGGTVTTSPTTAGELQLDEPVAVAASPTGVLYVADRAGGRVWHIAPDLTATLVASLPGPCALALDPARDLLWVGTSAGQVLRVTAAGGSASPDLATPVFTQPGQAVLGLASDQRGVLFVLAATAGGEARLWRLPTDSQGRLEAGQAATAIAGTGVAGASGADYVASTTVLADAREARLAVAHPGSLCLDLSAADAVATAAGQLYVGTSYAGDATWGQALRLDLAF
ncbi:MAG: hypothetical protein VKS61_11810 [Candidatus Sericytochromatia bacterium]|nr:hypothetical protein [Candidatus Sericytochromatia bacterium]